MASFLLQFSALALAGTSAVANAAALPPWRGDGKWASPKYPWIFEAELPQPEIFSPLYTCEINGTTVNFYQLTVDKFQKKIYPNLGPATFAGYNGKVIGPTFRVQRGTETVVRLINNNDLGSSMHLHGAWTRAPWDGWAADMVMPGQYKDYYYTETNSARTLWYHDHAEDHTAEDAYYGQSGFHIISDPEEQSLGLPSGKYDIPISIIDRRYKANGDLVSPADEIINFFGDIIHLNGQPWPYLKVEPRKYRFRFLNSGLSRAYNLGFMVDAVNMTQAFQIVGSDGGLFSAPVTTDSFTLSMGERYEVVFDFAGFENLNITLRNSIFNPEIMEFDQTDRLMRFVVGNKVTDKSNNIIPGTLSGPRSSGQLPPLPYRTDVDRTFNFARTNGDWTINGVTYDDVAGRTLARPPMGTIETWELRYAGGPGIHPIHMHLIDFMIVSRTGGRGEVLPYESGGLKDVVLLVPGETAIVTAFFGPWNGLYQFHCHNLIHEDHEMMAVFNTTVVKDLGYDLEDTLAFGDPMDPKYAARDYDPKVADDEDYITNKLLPSLVNSAAYRKLDEVIAAENQYYGRSTYGGDRPPGF